MARTSTKRSSLVGEIDQRTTKMLELASHLEKGFTKGSIRTLGEDISSAPTEFISSQHIGIDYVLGNQGFPVGRKSLITGGSATGKTTIGFHVIAETQLRGGIGIFIDSEYALDPDRARSIGINIEDLIIVEPDSLEGATSVIETLIEEIRKKGSGFEDVLFTVFLDSISGISTESENDDQKQIASHSRVYGKFLRRITRQLAQQRVCFIDVGQYRSKIDGISFGESPKTFLAEQPAKYHASIHLDVSSRGKAKVGTEIVGVASVVKNVKNKVGRPYREAPVQIGFDTGLNLVDGYLQLGLKYGLISKTGGWYTVKGDDKKFQASKFGGILEAKPELLVDIVEKTGYTYPADSLIWTPFNHKGLESEEVSIEELSEDDEE